MDHFHRLLVMWMVASTIHLPVPVCSANHLQSAQAHHSSSLPHSSLDIDFLHWGCILTEDSNGGPDDREPETEPPFSPKVIRSNVISLVHSHAQALAVNARGLDEASIDGTVSDHEQSSVDLAAFRFPFASSFRNGLAVLRC